jgi:hypothetical protein
VAQGRARQAFSCTAVISEVEIASDPVNFAPVVGTLRPGNLKRREDR